MGTKLGAPTDVVRVRAGEEETVERLRKLSCCLVEWRNLVDAGFKDH